MPPERAGDDGEQSLDAMTTQDVLVVAIRAQNAKMEAQEQLLRDFIAWIARGFKIVMAEDEVRWADEFDVLLQRAKALGIEPGKDVQ